MGNYVNRHLCSNEQIVHETTYHWIHFFSWTSLFTLGMWPLVQKKVDEFVVTNRRVIVRKGLIAYSTFEMNLDKIETVGIQQSIIGKMLGYGCITIIGAGGTQESLEEIKDPISFRKHFLQTAHEG